MNDMMNMLMAVVQTGDEAEPTKWIWGIVLVALAAVSVVMSKKKNAESADNMDQNKTDDKKEQ